MSAAGESNFINLSSFLGIVFIIPAIIIFCMSICIIDTGYRGIKTEFGKVSEETLSEGFYFVNPFTVKVHRLTVRTEVYDGSTQTYTKDVQPADIKYVVNFSVDPATASHLFQTVGYEYISKLITPVIEGSIKTTLGKWEAVELIANREKARAEVQLFLKQQLEPRGIRVENFQIVNIDYSNQFESAVEAKVVAIQNAEQARNKTVQVQEEANQRLIAAEADAKAMKIKSDALSQNPNLVSYEAVQKWDGALPTYMMGNSVPFINFSK